MVAIPSFIAVIALVLLLGPFSAYGQKPPSDVNVVNAPDVAVPGGVSVNGTVDVSGSMVDANQAGTWDVTVDNDGSNPVPVVSPLGETFTAPLTVTIPANGSDIGTPTFVVPAGKRMIIEHVAWDYRESSFSDLAPPGAKIRVYVRSEVGPTPSTSVFYPIGDQEIIDTTSIDARGSGSAPVRLYVNGGTVQCRFNRNWNGTSAYQGSCVLSGRLVDE